jgi:hypothetical protein
MTGDKTLLKEVQMAKVGESPMELGANPESFVKGSSTFQASEHLKKPCMLKGSRQISSASANPVTMTWWCNSPRRNVIYLTAVADGSWEEKELLINCYGLAGLTADPHIFCNKATIDDSELWHQRLGHLNFSDMLKIAGKDVKGLPKLEKTGKGICGPCQLGKQTRAAHKKTSGIKTSKNLELLHMDLMGPTRTASLCGKRYILVIVDDFS